MEDDAEITKIVASGSCEKTATSLLLDKYTAVSDPTGRGRRQVRCRRARETLGGKYWYMRIYPDGSVLEI